MPTICKEATAPAMASARAREHWHKLQEHIVVDQEEAYSVVQLTLDRSSGHRDFGLNVERVGGSHPGLRVVGKVHLGALGAYNAAHTKDSLMQVGPRSVITKINNKVSPEAMLAELHTSDRVCMRVLVPAVAVARPTGQVGGASRQRRVTDNDLGDRVKNVLSRRCEHIKIDDSDGSVSSKLQDEEAEAELNELVRQGTDLGLALHVLRGRAVQRPVKSQDATFDCCGRQAPSLSALFGFKLF